MLDENGNPILLPVTLGMNVFKGQVLGKFDDSELRSILKINQAQLEVAKAECDNTIEIKHAAYGVQVAMHELQQMQEANKKMAKAVSDTEVRRAAFAQHKAEAYLDLQKYTIEEIKTREVVVRESELEQTQDKIERRQLTAQIDGIIVEIKAAEGEWLREGEPVLEIMQLDTLWVSGDIPIKDYEISDVDGKSAVVQVVLANGKTETFQGTVVFCRPVIDSGNTFRTYIEIQNRRVGNHWLLQPGRGGIDITIAL
jgi:multidrug efflux pump subunit AcrA (membrane-fusion protein)